MSDSNWKFYASVEERSSLEIDGINVWNYNWNSDYEKVNVIDPLYGEEKTLIRYWIVIEDKTIEFVAGEFSNLIYGFYLKPKDLERQIKFKKDSSRSLIGTFFNRVFNKKNKR